MGKRISNRYFSWEQRGNFKIASLDDQRCEISALEDNIPGAGSHILRRSDRFKKLAGLLQVGEVT